MNLAPAMIKSNVCSCSQKCKTVHILSSHTIILVLLLTLTTLPVTAKPTVPPPPIPSRQALELIQKARQASKKGSDVIADKLWKKAGASDRAVPASPPDWKAERNPQPFTASLSDKAITRDELFVLISMLPYQKAQKQLKAFLDRFPLDKDLRELSLALADLHNDEKTQRLQSSALIESNMNGQTGVYILRVLMLIGFIILLRLLIKMHSGRPGMKRSVSPGSAKNAGEQL